MLPSLQRASQFMQNNSPSHIMLKFLDLVLSDILKLFQKPPQSMQALFLDLFDNFVPCIAYSMSEEVAFIFDKLLILCGDQISEKTLCSCIISLVDKFSVKSKQLKSTAHSFMKFVLNTSNTNEDEDHNLDQSLQRSNYFEMMVDFCFFSNQACGNAKQRVVLKQFEFRSPQDIHVLNIDKLQFLIESL
jgi:hypothetical protein